MAHTAAPMHEMNTTPLIDVLLVLLIMFIISIPAATHSVDIDMPGDCVDCPAIDADKNKLTIDDADRLHWNGHTTSREELRVLLQLSRRMPVEPELQFEPHALASYKASARALATIKASGVSKFGFVGNERYQSFGEAD